MRFLALDVGTKTIGIAVSDELGLTANPVRTIRRSGTKKDLETLGPIIEGFAPVTVVLGVPYGYGGGLGKRARAIVQFGERVKERFGVELLHWDESFSTSSAEAALIEADVGRKRRRKVIDKMAAVVILSEFLSGRAGGVGP